MLKGGKGEQLAMYAPAKSVRDSITTSWDTVGTEKLPEMWDRKLSEAKLPQGTMYEHPGGDYELGPWDEPVVDSQNSRVYKTAKLDHGTGVHDSIKETGYQGAPLVLNHGGSSKTGPSPAKWIEDGHHRLAAAADLNVEVPLAHDSLDAKWIRMSAMASGRQFDLRLPSDKKRDGGGGKVPSPRRSV